MRLKKDWLLTFFIIPGIFICGCNKSREDNKEKEKPSIGSIIDKESFETDEAKIKKAVIDWNSAMNSRDSERSRKLYAPEVFFYTTTLPSSECIDKKNQLLIADPSWSQDIVSYIEITENPDGTMEARFSKNTHGKKGDNVYRAYLVFKKFGEDWKIVKESDETTDYNISKKNKKTTDVPSDAIRGDFDGDGIIDRIWIEGNYDSEGLSITPLILRSDNNKIDGKLKWTGNLAGVWLVNLGDLANADRDFIGAVPYGLASNWHTYSIYGFKNENWKKIVDDFSVWLGDENMVRAYPADRRGYLYILWNNMDDVDEDFPTRTSLKQIRF